METEIDTKAEVGTTLISTCLFCHGVYTKERIGESHKCEQELAELAGQPANS